MSEAVRHRPLLPEHVTFAREREATTRAADVLCRARAPPTGSIRREAREPVFRRGSPPGAPDPARSILRLERTGTSDQDAFGRVRCHFRDRARRRCLDSPGAAPAHPAHPPGRPPSSKGWDRRPANQAHRTCVRRTTDTSDRPLPTRHTSHVDSAPRSFPWSALRPDTGNGSFSRRPVRLDGSLASLGRHFLRTA